MSTTITPGVGSGVLFTAQGDGTSPGYTGIDLRRSDSLSLQEGVYGASDFMVVQKAAGANMSVDIGMPAGGFACVQGDSVAGQGLYVVPVHASTINEAVAAADATNPRVDSVILEVLDNVHDASGSSLSRVRVLTGTPTAGATLANRTGAVALPSSALLLADFLVSAGATSVDNTKIRDRRKFARGARVVINRASSDRQTSSGSFALVDATNVQPRIECSGAPLRVVMRGELTIANASDWGIIRLWVDGAEPSGGYLTSRRVVPRAANEHAGFDITWNFTPVAGSHLIGPAWAANLGTNNVTIPETGGFSWDFTIEEVVRQSTANNTVTSG